MRHIKKLKSLSLNRNFTYAGHSYGANSEAEIDQITEKEVWVILESTKICKSIGITILKRSIRSTPTFKKADKIKGITEIRSGNAVFFDMIQVDLNIATREQCALTVVSTVGTKHKNWIVIGAGREMLNLDKGEHTETKAL